MRQMPEIIDFGRDIVNTLNADSVLQATLQQAIGVNYKGIQYYAGHPLEVLQRIQLKQGTSYVYEKYPAWCLFLDTPQTTGTVKGAAYSAETLQIIIAMGTEEKYYTEERHMYNFVPILLPLYYATMDAIARNKNVVNSVAENIIHQRINRYRWGKEGLYGKEGNIFNDRIDAIELRNLQLNFNFLNC